MPARSRRRRGPGAQRRRGRDRDRLRRGEGSHRLCRRAEAALDRLRAAAALRGAGVGLHIPAPDPRPARPRPASRADRRRVPRAPNGRADPPPATRRRKTWGRRSHAAPRHSHRRRDRDARRPLQPDGRPNSGELRDAGSQSRHAHARPQRIAAAADRDRRRAEGHQPLGVRSAARVRYAGVVGGAIVRCEIRHHLPSAMATSTAIAARQMRCNSDLSRP